MSFPRFSLLPTEVQMITFQAAFQRVDAPEFHRFRFCVTGSGLPLTYESEYKQWDDMDAAIEIDRSTYFIDTGLWDSGRESCLGMPRVLDGGGHHQSRQRRDQHAIRQAQATLSFRGPDESRHEIGFFPLNDLLIIQPTMLEDVAAAQSAASYDQHAIQQAQATLSFRVPDECRHEIGFFSLNDLLIMRPIKLEDVAAVQSAARSYARLRMKLRTMFRPQPLFSRALRHVAFEFDPLWDAHPYRDVLMLDVMADSLEHLGGDGAVYVVDYALKRPQGSPPLPLNDRNVFKGNGGSFVQVHYEERNEWVRDANYSDTVNFSPLQLCKHAREWADENLVKRRNKRAATISVLAWVPY